MTESELLKLKNFRRASPLRELRELFRRDGPGDRAMDVGAVDAAPRLPTRTRTRTTDDDDDDDEDRGRGRPTTRTTTTTRTSNYAQPSLLTQRCDDLFAHHVSKIVGLTRR